MMQAWLSQQAVLLAAAWTSGISLYLTAALLGLAGRAGWVDLPGGLDALEHPLVIALAAALFFVEFFADKVPFVDSAWDGTHTFIRPVGAAVAGFLAGTEHGPLAQTAYALLTGTIALDAHAVKASTRLAINTSPEPFSNVAMSLVEHSAVLFLLWLCIRHPFIASVVVILLLAGSFFVLRALGRFVRRLFRSRAAAGAPPPGGTA
jgi:hypothetical protein